MEKPVKILWRDPVSWTGWAREDRIKQWAYEEEDGGLNESLGWIIENTPDFLVFSPSRQIHGAHLGDSHKLPKSVVISVQDLKTGRKVKI